MRTYLPGDDPRLDVLQHSPPQPRHRDCWLVWDAKEHRWRNECRECIRKFEPYARFTDDDRATWTEATNWDMTSTKIIWEGTLYRRADEGAVCENHLSGEGCMGDFADAEEANKC